MNGFFLVDKPKNCTSQQVVSTVKKKFNLSKCGHNGTLDPNTTGLMIVACNEATKLMKYLVSHDKVYETTILFGYDSTTLDYTGEITSEIEMNVLEENLDEALDSLKQATIQFPPMYSAIKLKGRKLYEYARMDQAIEVEPRNVTLYDVQKLSNIKVLENGHLAVDLRLHCSKGFYVRSFARDLGKLLNGCAIMGDLRRIRSGKFSISEATSLVDLKREHLYSILDFFPDFERLEVNDYIAKLAMNGVIFDERQIKTEKPFYVVHKNAIIAIYEAYQKFQYKPIIIFKDPVIL